MIFSMNLLSPKTEKIATKSLASVPSFMKFGFKSRTFHIFFSVYFLNEFSQYQWS